MSTTEERRRAAQAWAERVLALTEPSACWPRLELGDTLEQERERTTKRPCRYCATWTTSTIGICLAHEDLFDLDPHLGSIPEIGR